MGNYIAVIGLACCYPDATSPHELWANVLAKRRAFRAFPRERLSMEDYWSDDPLALDCTYVKQGAFLKDYHFDRVKYRISGEAFRASDMTHWLALDMAALALEDAGFPAGSGIPKETAAVYLGNTLTGEFSRSSVVRQRWPYVRRLTCNLLAGQMADAQAAGFLAELEEAYKAPFPDPGAESLVGGLANTIAGRICNYFDLKGGGYIVDGACASSLLAVAQASSALLAGDIDVAIVGGVDLSMDPFELVGFARVGALAKGPMRVYDQRPTGFLPGEGCGMAVLMRQQDAIEAKRRIYCTIRGWGISSDGSGGMTRPEVAGQILALQRAYRRAGFGLSEVGYIEGHGTGTELGDAVELQALSTVRGTGSPARDAAVIGTVKANVGHTKAAAGIAGLIKAGMAIWHGVLPPTTGCEQPHDLIRQSGSPLRTLASPLAWDSPEPLRAGVSAMGFGGINAHVVLEGTSARPRGVVNIPAPVAPDVELFLFSGLNRSELLAQVSAFADEAGRLSQAEMGDAAVALSNFPFHPVRLAVIASTPMELLGRLKVAQGLIEQGNGSYLDNRRGIYIGATRTCRIGYAFPGQASPVRRSAGALAEYFSESARIFERAAIPEERDSNTAVAQPSIVASALAGVAALTELGVTAQIAVGHSVGDIAALCWAGAFSYDDALRLARERGRLMSECGVHGVMANITADLEQVQLLCNNGGAVSIAAVNAPRQVVISGDAQEAQHVISKARANGLHVVTLPVSVPFHSPFMSVVTPALRTLVAASCPQTPNGKLYSSITGDLLPAGVDLVELLVHQVTARVDFKSAIQHAAPEADLFIEVGPGTVLTGLIPESAEVPVVALDSGAQSHRSLFSVVGALFSFGVELRLEKLFGRRFAKPFRTGQKQSFLANPCESVNVVAKLPLAAARKAVPVANGGGTMKQADSTLEVVRRIVAETVELPLRNVRSEDRFFEDLRLSSIVVATIAAKAARELNRVPLQIPTSFANGSLDRLAEALDQCGSISENPQSTEGLSNWTRCFVHELVPLHLEATAAHGRAEWNLHIPPHHPLKEPLTLAFSRPGQGTVFCLEPDTKHEGTAALLLETLRELPSKARFGLIHHGFAPVAFLRSAHAERPDLVFSVVRIPVSGEYCETAYREILSARGMEVVWYEDDGTRKVPRLRTVSLDAGPFPLTSDDVLLVTGGARGIGAECALFLARKSKARVILLGRSEVTDPEVTGNILRFSAAGVPFLYLRTDITDSECVSAIRKGCNALGTVTAVLHSAAVNTPQPLSTLSEADILRTLAPKKIGLANVLAAIDPNRLKLCISFGSIIGSMGMEGNADYAFANEVMRSFTATLAAQFPKCRFRHLEWSLWSGVGMAERLGSVERFAAAGMSAISPEQGVEMLDRILCANNPPAALIVASRFTKLPRLRFSTAVPMLRFLEEIKVFVPGVELIADARLTPQTDPYLSDHVLDGTAILPAVVGMEAMAQVAKALGMPAREFAWRGLEFVQPITLTDSGAVVIRLYGMVDENGSVRVSIRSSETRFTCDHFRGTLTSLEAPAAHPPIHIAADSHLPAHDPAVDLYGRILFQSGRFQRIHSYQQLTATSCRVLLQPQEQSWVGPYLPAEFVAGDPGLRDAAIHCIQACIPHRTLVPVRVDEIRSFSPLRTLHVTVHARERSSNGREFLYDIDLCSDDGTLIEQWRSVLLSAVETTSHRVVQAELLIGPYLQRRASELLPDVALNIELATGNAHSTAALLSKAAGANATVLKRSDGKPQAFVSQGAPGQSTFVSATNAPHCSLAVGCSEPVGCDLEPVEERQEEIWNMLLGAEHFQYCRHLSSFHSIEFAEAATRIWCIKESFLKMGEPSLPLLHLTDRSSDGWMIFRANHSHALTWSFLHSHRRYALAIVIGNSSQTVANAKPAVEETLSLLAAYVATAS